MQSPLPAIQGTSDAVLNQGLKLLQKRLLAHGGQLVDNDENIALLAAHMRAHGVNPGTTVYKAEQILDALWVGTCELFGRLQFNPMPQKLYDKLQEARAQRLELRDKARRDKDAAENIQMYNLQERVGKEQEKKAKEDQKITDEKATAEIARLIGDYSVNASQPGRLDHTKSEEGRAFLRKIKITSGGKYSPVLTLQAVEQCRWCDSVEAMSRQLDRFISDYNNAEKNERERQRQLERSGYVGARGGII